MTVRLTIQEYPMDTAKIVSQVFWIILLGMSVLHRYMMDSRSRALPHASKLSCSISTTRWCKRVLCATDTNYSKILATNRLHTEPSSTTWQFCRLCIMQTPMMVRAIQNNTCQEYCIPGKYYFKALFYIKWVYTISI